MKTIPTQLSAISIDLIEFEAILITVLVVVSVIALVAVAITRSRSIKRADEANNRKVIEALRSAEAEDRKKSEEETKV